MRHDVLSRRRFATSVGAALGAALILPKLGDSLADARQPIGVPDDVIQLNSNENPYGPFPSARQAMTRSQAVAARYPDALETRMVEAIAKHHGVQPDNVLLGCGSGEILRVADMAFLAGGKSVVVAEPTFEAVLGYARVTAARPVKVPLTPDFRHDLPAMAHACDANTGLVYLCNPNNPTATIVHRDEMDSFLARVPRATAILVDEAYHHFVDDPRYASSFNWFPRQSNLIIVRTFSKIYGMAGMRLGYAVASRENIQAMRPYATWNNANASVLDAAIASLADSPEVARQRKLFINTRNWLCRELDKDHRRYMPSHANFVMIDVGGDVRPVIDAFRKRKILVGRKFPALANWLRISIGTQKETETFMAALRDIVPVKASAA